MIKKITRIINDWDPIGLFPYSPKDEYEVEICLILDLLNQSKELQFLANGIKDIFVRRFGDDVFLKNSEECIEIANKILKMPD